MNKRNCLILLFFSALYLINCMDVYSYEGSPTHEDLSSKAAEQSVIGNEYDYLKNIGIEDGLKEPIKWSGIELIIEKWIEQGGTQEDAGNFIEGFMNSARYNNHFHNPLKNVLGAGLDDYFLGKHLSGKSSVLWAQDGASQALAPEGDWTWGKVRGYYYLGLIGRTDSDRQENFARMFRGLGHQMHFKQDKSVPAHKIRFKALSHVQWLRCASA